MKSPELIAKMLADGEIAGAAAIFAAELDNQLHGVRDPDDLDEAMEKLTACLPADPDLRKRMLALVPHVTRARAADVGDSEADYWGWTRKFMDEE